MRVRCVSIGSRGPHATRDSFDRALPRPSSRCERDERGRF